MYELNVQFLFNSPESSKLKYLKLNASETVDLEDVFIVYYTNKELEIFVASNVTHPMDDKCVSIKFYDLYPKLRKLFLN